ncbi:MAG: nucleotidyltransferase family protein [Synergistaceae bacterium]|jgi:predicted nucleotidyltransferase|nr:nucleotidyltransferase family protein [Synergistaceae bacterium]
MGIVAEYNPFHLGHRYHIGKSREYARADAIIALISSNFTQRGEPALLDKLARARMALLCGANLALELPCVFSCRNAGIFADAAVDTLAQTGIVDCISFGIETPDEKKTLFEPMAAVLNDEPPAFKDSLKKFLSTGYSFVQSRSMALEELIPGALEILKCPNSNLGLAYIKRILEKKYPMETLSVQRIGAGFHSKTAGCGEIASASAIRGMISSGETETALRFMPESCARIVWNEIKKGHAALNRDRLWRAVKQVLIRASAEELSGVAEMREGLENRMKACAYLADSLDSFVDMCTSRRYPRGRIQRYCVHTLLNLRSEQSEKFQKNGPAYIRVLGADETGKELLRMMRGSATLPVLSKAGGRMSAYAWEIMRFEKAASEMWETLTESPRKNAESGMFPILQSQLND